MDQSDVGKTGPVVFPERRAAQVVVPAFTVPTDSARRGSMFALFPHEAG